ncbi:hypothetical protein OGAPHI_004915 [Ogataea philodendri]|uniref:CN hydrolase domain-containing protein n=1 Tax=Ogataea philodendri TaxID=1378263 RepID=A0A9P8T2T5_9ASCO|nr:uncharacterized protein OGAPHI_004915 [Ogataea philodendri]KAH3663514.1 hypothetical protein OGAPHI_004915 [Ogataea philodendri]
MSCSAGVQILAEGETLIDSYWCSLPTMSPKISSQMPLSKSRFLGSVASVFGLFSSKTDLPLSYRSKAGEETADLMEGNDGTSGDNTEVGSVKDDNETTCGLSTDESTSDEVSEMIDVPAASGAESLFLCLLKGGTLSVNSHFQFILAHSRHGGSPSRTHPERRLRHLSHGRTLRDLYGLCGFPMKTVGRIDIDTPYEEVIERMIKLLDEAHANGVKLVNFPELTFTTFFPRYVFPFGPELDKWYQSGEVTEFDPFKPFFEKAKEYEIAVCVGYAELTEEKEHFNTSVFVDQKGNSINKYRKMHLPGDKEPLENVPWQHLEKRYFLEGNYNWTAFRWPGTGTGNGGPVVGQLICNDRRWAESWRILGLQGAEIVCIGFNTPVSNKADSDGQMVNADANEEMASFHNDICLQYNSYNNCCYSLCSARTGVDDGKYSLIGGSTIVDPEGVILAKTKTHDDELIWTEVDLDRCYPPRGRIFNFERHRRPDQYKRIVEQKGVIYPPPQLWKPLLTVSNKTGCVFFAHAGAEVTRLFCSTQNHSAVQWTWNHKPEPAICQLVRDGFLAVRTVLGSFHQQGLAPDRERGWVVATTVLQSTARTIDNNVPWEHLCHLLQRAKAFLDKFHAEEHLQSSL